MDELGCILDRTKNWFHIRYELIECSAMLVYTEYVCSVVALGTDINSKLYCPSTAADMNKAPSPHLTVVKVHFLEHESTLFSEKLYLGKIFRE